MTDKKTNQTGNQSLSFDFIDEQSSQPISNSILEAHSQAGIPPKKLRKKEAHLVLKNR